MIGTNYEVPDCGSSYVNEIIREYEHGFRTNRSIVDIKSTHCLELPVLNIFNRSWSFHFHFTSDNVKTKYYPALPVLNIFNILYIKYI